MFWTNLSLLILGKENEEKEAISFNEIFPNVNITSDKDYLFKRFLLERKVELTLDNRKNTLKVFSRKTPKSINDSSDVFMVISLKKGENLKALILSGEIEVLRKNTKDEEHYILLRTTGNVILKLGKDYIWINDHKCNYVKQNRIEELIEKRKLSNSIKKIILANRNYKMIHSHNAKESKRKVKEKKTK